MADVTDELMDAQQTAKQAGKIRFAGVSTHAGQAELIPALVKTGKIDVILCAYNFTLDPTIGRPSTPPTRPGWASWA